MQYEDAKALDGELVVVELQNGTAWLGVAEVSPTSITIRTGHVGRPPVVPLDEVDLALPAFHHRDVVTV